MELLKTLRKHRTQIFQLSQMIKKVVQPCLLLSSILLLGGSALAEDSPERITTQAEVKSNYLHAISNTVISASKFPGESIGLADRSIHWNIVDMEIPGNGIPITVSRTHSPGDFGWTDWWRQEMYGWSLGTPKIIATSRTAGAGPGLLGGLKGCKSNLWGPLNNTFNVSINGVGGFRPVARSTTDKITYPENVVTQFENNWLLLCEDYTTRSVTYNTDDTQEGQNITGGITLLSPQGIKYHFAYGARDKIWGLPVGKQAPGQVTAELVYYVSDIEDQFGNYLTYHYSGFNSSSDRSNSFRLDKITANDGRQVDFNYIEDDTGRHLDSVVSGSREVIYDYSQETINGELQPINLSKVIYLTKTPLDKDNIKSNEGLTWEYKYHDAKDLSPIRQVKTPWGASIDYTYLLGAISETCLMKDSTNYYSTGLIYPSLRTTPFVHTRNVTVSGKNYNYSYSTEELGAGSNRQWITEVVGPENKQRFYHDCEESELAKNLTIEKHEIYEVSGTIPLKTIENTWIAVDDGGDFYELDRVGVYPLSRSRKVQTQQKVTLSNGDVYTTNYPERNAFAQTTKIIESNNVNNKARYTKLGFQHNFFSWIINQPTTTDVSATDANYTRVNETSYYPAAHATFASLPSEYKRFGTWIKRFDEYHSSGELKKVSLNERIKNSEGTEASTSRYVTFDNYKRGIAQAITFPGRYSDSASSRLSVSRVVNDDGMITSSTDLNGVTTTYAYDKLGRQIAINNLGTWADTFIDWQQTATGRIGVKTHCILNTDLTACNAGTTIVSTTTTYDGMFRPVNVATTDNASNITVYSLTRYDSESNKTFTSFPSNSSIASAGVHFDYDGLQRLRAQTTTGGGTVSTEYLTGNKIRVTDAGKNTNNIMHSTTTTYLAYGVPDYSLATRIESPESVTTDIAINLFGNITSITQSGKNGPVDISQTEYRAYDSHQFLCQIKRDDVGAIVLNNNVLGEVQWQAQGQIAISNTECNSSASDASKVSYRYDNLGNQHQISYGNSATPRTLRLDNNGNIKSITGDGFSQSYNYNSLNLLEDETLNVDGKKLTLDYSYNSMGYLNELTYPDETAPVKYSPNGFGQATQAIRFDGTTINSEFVKAGASYWPNGIVNTFVYGNGYVHKTELNDRLLPQSISDVSGSTDAVSLSYRYDNNSNVIQITNHREPNYSLTSLTYDGLDRLTATTGAIIGIGSSRITYDGIGNIRSYNNDNVANGHSYIYKYGSQNRLTDILNSDNSATEYQFSQANSYDERGNVTFNGRRQFEYNLANQMVKSGENEYLYDGHNRRIRTKDSKGTSYSMYSQSGQLLYRETTTGSINYIYLGNKLVAKEGTGVVSPKNNDGETSIANYKPFGGIIESTIDGKPYADNRDEVGFTGHKFDTDLELSYMQARYYDPVIGRFYSNDPVGWTPKNPVMSFNRYLYVNNNPYKYTDPNGEFLDAIVDIGFIAYDLYDMATNGVNATNSASLTANVAGLMIPGATGLGLAVRAGDKGVDAANVLRRTCCFVAGTQVLTEDGYKNIEDVKLGEKLWAKNTETGEQDWKPVTKIFVEPDRGIFEIKLVASDGFEQKIQATDDHPFYVIGKGWKQTIELKVGDKIETDGNGAMEVVSVIDEQRLDLTYNFTVADFHTYYVTKKNVLVHNCNYIPAPKEIEGISGLTPAKPKTSVQGGGGLRKRWKDKKGNIYEWDSQHGTLEKYNKRGKHQGEFDPKTGEQTKPKDKKREVEP